jgi:hypothetical protein
MASALHLMRHMDLGHESGPLGVLVEGGLGFGVSYGIGRVYHQYGHKWAGRNVARLTAIAGKVGALVSSVALGPGWVTGCINTAGQAGLNAIGLDLGLRHARKKTGMKGVLVHEGTDVKKLGGHEMSAIGALGKAQPGRGLSWDAIEELASAH